mgnify:CR=1
MSAEYEKEQGNKEYKKRNFPKALHYYNKAIQLNPKNIIYLTNKAGLIIEFLQIIE